MMQNEGMIEEHKIVYSGRYGRVIIRAFKVNIFKENINIIEPYFSEQEAADITGYTFNLSTAEVYSGYIIVSSNEYEMPIQKFLFHDKQIFKTNVEARLVKNVK